MHSLRCFVKRKGIRYFSRGVVFVESSTELLRCHGDTEICELLNEFAVRCLEKGAGSGVGLWWGREAG